MLRAERAHGDRAARHAVEVLECRVEVPPRQCDEVGDGRGTEDCNGHGTHVAGTVGSQTYGVAKAVSIIPVRVLSCTGRGSIFSVLSGVEWMIDHHVAGEPAVANMSLGGSRNSGMNDAVANAVQDGITMVVAAGSLSAAGRRMGLSPAMVSKRLARLEARLDRAERVIAVQGNVSALLRELSLGSADPKDGR